MVNLRIPAKQTHAPFLQRQRQAEIAAIREFGGWHRDDSVERVGGTGTVIRWVAPGRHGTSGAPQQLAERFAQKSG